MNTPALEETSDQLAILEDRQPSPESAVWQHNEVAVARYLLTEAEQKLLLYVVAMIAPDATQFSRYRVEVAAYAEACGLSGKSVYETVAAAALSIQKQRPLVIMDHPDPQTGELGILSTHWFSEVQLNPGSVTVVFPPSLSRYLVAVKKEFFQYELGIALHFRGEYPARLYQWARSQAFRGRVVLPLAELRAVLGLVEWDDKGNPRKYDEKGKPIKERLPAYADMKKWALRPALAEIERVSDISVKIKERKKPGTKTVEAIEFFISKNPAYQSAAPATLKQLPAAKVVTVNPATATFIDELRKEFALGPRQAREALAKHGIEYVKEKAVIVRSEPRPNAAKALAAAIRDDWQAGKKIERKPPAKKAAPALAPVEGPKATPMIPTAHDWEGLKKEAFGKKSKGQDQAAPVPAAAVAASEGDELPF